MRKEMSTKVLCVALIVIVVYAVIYSAVTAVGPSYNGDDMAYAGLDLQIIHGIYQETSYIYTVRFLQIFPIAAFYSLLGVSGFSSAAWNILSFVASVVITYFIANELQDRRTGLIAAFLFCFFPLVLDYTGTMSDDLPLMMLVSLTVLCLVYAMKRKSRAWYFASGALLVTPPLVTPLGFIIIPFIVLYLAIELVRRKLTLNRTTLYFVYGLLFAGGLLMLVNYVLSGDPLMTLTLNTYYYSKPGAPGFGTLGALAGPWFYIDTIFPYRILSFIYNIITRHQLNALNLWENNTVGFYFYAFVVCAAYLIARRDRRAYLPLLWFTVMFVYLSIGPEYITLNPFSYTLMIRLDRYMMPLAIPVVLIIAMGIIRFVEDGKSLRSKRVRMSISSLAVVFLILTAIPLNLFWYNTKVVQFYDQLQIAKYIGELPNTTSIFYLNGLSQALIFSGAHNISRFHVYDQISNCSMLPNGAYVIVPKYVEYYGLAYTPDPSNYCPNWKLVLYPELQENFSSAIMGQSIVFRAKLYHIKSGTG